MAKIGELDWVKLARKLGASVEPYGTQSGPVYGKQPAGWVAESEEIKTIGATATAAWISWVFSFTEAPPQEQVNVK